VLFGVSIEVHAGECVCLLGRNGVGKTTTMRSIMGLTPPQSGRVAFKGADITGWEPYRVARAGIGFVPEDRRIFADLTVWENLDVAERSRKPSRSGHPRHEPDAQPPIQRSQAASTAGHPRPEPHTQPPLQRSQAASRTGHPRPEPHAQPPLQRSQAASRTGYPRPEPHAQPPIQWTAERVFDLFPTLRQLTSRNGGYLSGGEQQMLTIARTLMGNPELLLLDEPSEGLAPLVVDHLGEQIARLKAEGLTILLAEQNTDFSLRLADRVYVLEKGAIRFSGAAAALRDNEALRHELLAL
jgi:ABC-type branched-subunit amino acid transport system ATPase component